MGNKNNISTCPACGQKIVDYKHNINKTLVSCLWHLYRVGGRARLDTMQLDNTQFTNFQKLRYFHLVVATGQHSEWQITKEGTEFLQGRCKIPKFVITRNALVKQISDEPTFVQDVKECVAFKVDWQEQAEHPTLFDQEGVK